jgi:hypothetical protein
VVNAEATQKNLSLLTKINTGSSLQALAVGGIVGEDSSLMAVPPIRETEHTSGGKSVKQTFNWNFTGDISRQTRAEVYRLIPQIAEGVNVYNKEIGYGRER